jgi:hypothetical protein
MDDETSPAIVAAYPRATRRGILAGLAGAAAALLGRAVIQTPSARASDGDNLVLGDETNAAESMTKLTTTFASPATTDDAVQVVTNGDATAIRAVTQTGTALVAGATGVGIGIRGEGTQAVVGDASVAGPGSIGVYGLSDGNESGYGVYGQHGDSSGTWTGGGQAVRGESYSENGTGVFGQGPQYGVYGQTENGAAGFFLASGSTGTALRGSAPDGTALDVNGVAKFSRSGQASVGSGTSQVTVSSVPLSASSLVLAVLKTNLTNTHVRAVVPNVAGSSFVIYLNRPAPGAGSIAWFVVN